MTPENKQTLNDIQAAMAARPSELQSVPVAIPIVDSSTGAIGLLYVFQGELITTVFEAGDTAEVLAAIA